MKELLTEFFASLLGEVDKKKTAQPKRKEGESPEHPGFFHRGKGFYSQGSINAPITHKTVDGKMKTLSAKERAEKNPTETPGKNKVGAKKTPPKQKQPEVPRTKSAPAVEPTAKKKKTPKNKELDQSKPTVENFNSDPRFAKDGVSDSDFRKNKNAKPTSKQIKPSQIESFFLDKNGNTRFPRKYIKVLSRLLSTKPGALTISDFTNASGAGTLSSTCGELLTMMALTIKDDKKAEEFFNLISTHIKGLEKGKESIIDSGWVNSARKVRTLMFKRYDKMYGKGNWELDNMAWDIQDEVEGLGLSDYKKNKGFSTDVYAKVKVKGKGYILDEISLKKEVRANLLNATSGRVSDIMVYGAASPEDISLYEDLNSRIDALGRAPTAENKRERVTLIKQRDELIKKYNADVPDDVKVEVAVERQQNIYRKFASDSNALAEARSFFKKWSSGSPKFKATIAAKIAKELNQKEAYIKKIITQFNQLSKQTFKDEKEFVSAIQSIVGGDTSDGNKLMLSIMRGVQSSSPDSKTKCANYANSLVENSHRHSRSVRDFLLKDKKARRGLLMSIRDAFPLRALFEGEESMALGDVMADRAILQNLFGTDNFDEIEQKLSIRDEPPPPSIVYRAVGKEDIPIAEIVSRPDGIAYGSTWKLIMAVHPDFAKRLQQANREVLG